MKKIFLIISILSCLTLLSCSSIKEYKGKKINKLTYTTVEYMGGYTKVNEFDFVNNNYSTIDYYAYDEETPETEIKSSFSDNEEKTFIDSCYSYGLFDLKESYEPLFPVMDGSGWELTIEYEDGTKKVSEGNNARPTKVFNNCATAFYDLCGYSVIGSLPPYYAYPPNISYSFRYQAGNTNVSTNEITKVIRANYKWNKFESLDNNLYSLNELSNNEFNKDYSYSLVLYTSNYDCSEKFNKIIVKEYDFNKELSNEKTIYTGKWFKQIELNIEVNKIYVYELHFKDGDYVQYTFNTKCS